MLISSSPRASGPTKILQDGVSRKEAFAWASLDFANSGYTTVVLTAVFNAYFVSTVMGQSASATLVWTLILAVSYLIVMITAPIVGAYADLKARKKNFLVWTTLGCVMATALLATVGPGLWAWAAVLLVISNVCYATHQDLVAAFLPELARPDQLGRVSGYGWAWGYAGGLIALGLSLAWVIFAPVHLERWGAESVAQDPQWQVAGTMLITASLFLVVAVPALLVLRERALPVQSEPHWLRASWGRLFETWRASREHPDLRRFLVCVVVYHAGVQTVITLAAVYAQQAMGFTLRETIGLILVVNITAVLGAWLFGLFQDRLGHTKSLALALMCWIAMVLIAWVARTETLFWVAANFAGLAMGASQSGARAAVAYLAKPGHQAETFGLWGVAANCSAILGPVSYGLTTWLTNNDHRTAILVSGLFFLIGLGLLFRVDFDRGYRDSRQAVHAPTRIKETS